MMLTAVRILNFRCFQRLEVDLKPLTVLIGPNNTGKSAFIDVLALAGRPQLKAERLDHWRGETSKPIRIVFFAGGAEHLISTEDPVYRESPITASLHRLPAHGITLTDAGQDDAYGPLPLGACGEGISALADYLLRRDRRRFDAFVQDAREHIPGLQDIEIRTPEGNTRLIALRMEQGFTIDGNRTSAGTRLILFFLALAHHPARPDLILLEEPETGVHPHRLKQVVQLLRKIVDDPVRPSQVVLSTHSPYLVDLVDLERDQVLVFERSPGGACNARPVDRQRLHSFLDEFQLGEIWYNQQEHGLTAK